MEKISALGASGLNYWYWASPLFESWQDIPANYLFAKRGPRFWEVVYIGQCQSAKDRLAGHERLAEAIREYGVTHILTHAASQYSEVREREERDLIQSHNPPMNVQHRPHPGNTLLTQGFGLTGLSGLGLINQRGTR